MSGYPTDAKIMGVIKRGILGGFSGSVGNVVGSSWKGIATMKAKPLSVANPNTAGQVVQRTKMSNLVAFAKEILANIIKPLNDRFASGMSGFNLFTQRNIDLFTTAVPDPIDGIILSRGTLAPMALNNLTADRSNNEIKFDYSDNSGEGDALATDEAYAVVMNTDLGEITSASGGLRNAGEWGFALPAGWLAGHNIQGWVSFRRADGTKVSDTVSDGAVIIA